MTRSIRGSPAAFHAPRAASASSARNRLVAKTLAACERHDVGTLVIGGGFSANSRLREFAGQRCAEAGVEVRIPPIRYCTDNGAMIAALGSAVVRAGVAPSSLDITTDSAMPLAQICV